MASRTALIAAHRKFFSAYRQRFAEIFIKVCHVLAPQFTDVTALREGCLDFYDQLFVRDGKDQIGPFEGKLMELEEAGLNVGVILSKAFAVMTRDFVNYAIKSGDVVTPVNGLTGLMQASLMVLDHSTGYSMPGDSAVVRMLREHESELLQLEGFYRGVPMRDAVVLLDAPPGTGTVTLHVADERKVNFEHDSLVRLTAQFLPRPLEARVLAIDHEARDLTLGQLQVSEHDSLPRSAIRVQPRDEIPVQVEVGNEQWPAVLNDLSLGGISINVEQPLPIEKGQWISVAFHLPLPTAKEPALISARAEVVNTIQRQQLHRYGLSLMHSTQVENLLSEYITHRQSEVISMVQPEIHGPIHLEREKNWDLRTIVTVLILVTGISVFATFAYLTEKKGGSRDLAWVNTAEYLAKQRECGQLIDLYQQSPNTQLLHRVQQCSKELDAIGGRQQGR